MKEELLKINESCDSKTDGISSKDKHYSFLRLKFSSIEKAYEDFQDFLNCY